MFIDNQVFDVVYDTGSDWLVIESEACTSCSNARFRFDHTKSKDFKVSTSNVSDRNYGSANLKGFEVKDTVCVADQLCQKDFGWFLIDS